MIFDWNVDPTIVELFGSFPLKYYGLLFGLGLMLGYTVVSKIWQKEGLSLEQLDKLALWVFLATIFGARIGHCLFYEPEYYFANPLEMILPFRFGDEGIKFTGFQGLASHGGVAGVILSIYLFSRKYKINVLALLDKVSIGGALTAVFIRLANFMNSEIIGKPTEGDFGVIFRQVDGLPRHPAQLYESFCYLLIFIIIFYTYKKYKERFGDRFLFGLFITLVFSVRFIIEFFKENQVDFEDGMLLNMGQWLSIPFIVVGGFIMIWKRSRK